MLGQLPVQPYERLGVDDRDGAVSVDSCATDVPGDGEPGTLCLFAEQVSLSRRDADVGSDTFVFRGLCTSLSLFSVLTMDGATVVPMRISAFVNRASLSRHKKLNLMLRSAVHAGPTPRHPLGMVGQDRRVWTTPPFRWSCIYASYILQPCGRRSR